MLLGILSIIISLGAVFVMVTLLLAGSANGSAEFIATVKRSLLSLAVVTVVALALSVWAMISARTALSVCAGLAPTVWSIVLFFIIARTDSAS